MAKAECVECNRQFHSEESLKQHIAAKHNNDGKSAIAKFNITKRHYFLIGSLLFFSVIAYLIYDSLNSPGKYDNLAKCLSDNGAVMYGTDRCKYCKEQKGLFGKSFEYVNYINCDILKADCVAAGVTRYPQWIINESRYMGVQSLFSLAHYAECVLE